MLALKLVKSARDPAARNVLLGVLLLTSILTLAACGGNQSNAEDDRRVKKLASYELLDTAPPGAKVVRPRFVSKSTTADVQFMNGGPHGAGAEWSVTDDVGALAAFYVNALTTQGWRSLAADCGSLPPEQRRQVFLRARRPERGYQTIAVVELTEQAAGGIIVSVVVNAPFHDEDAIPGGNSPRDLSCLSSGDVSS